jgi:hypothetical protein
MNSACRFIRRDSPFEKIHSHSYIIPRRSAFYENTIYFIDASVRYGLSYVSSYDMKTDLLKKWDENGIRGITDPVCLRIDERNGDVYVFSTGGWIHVIRNERFVNLLQTQEAYHIFSACILGDRILILTYGADDTQFTIKEYDIKTKKYRGVFLKTSKECQFIVPTDLETNSRQDVVVFDGGKGYFTINVFDKNGFFLFCRDLDFMPISSHIIIDEYDRYALWDYSQDIPIVHIVDQDLTEWTMSILLPYTMNGEETKADYVCCLATKRVFANKKKIVD